jgi:hypothetical protein
MSEISFSQKLNDLLLSNLPLSGSKSTDGFQQVKCPCCNDYKSRGGWKIELGSVFYNCFNCAIKGGWTEGDERLSKNFIKILNDFGINSRDITELKGVLFFNKPLAEEKVITAASLNKVNLFTPEVPLPEGCIRIDDSSQSQLVKDYLISRKIDPDSYPFYINPFSPYYVIIPFYKQTKIVYWQSRSINLLKAPLRYKNCSVPKDAIIFNYDALFYYSNNPLYVCEGLFDALVLNGICLLGSSLSETKIEILKKTNRKLIFVIDKDANGRSLGEKVFDEKLGSITFCSYDKNIKSDVNKMMQETGKIWTITQLINNEITSEKQAKFMLNSLPVLRRKNGRK